MGRVLDVLHCNIKRCNSKMGTVPYPKGDGGKGEAFHPRYHTQVNSASPFILTAKKVIVHEETAAVVYATNRRGNGRGSHGIIIFNRGEKVEFDYENLHRKNSRCQWIVLGKTSLVPIQDANGSNTH